MTTKFAFHAGERAVQSRAGEAMIADRNFTVMSDTVLPGARTFIEKQSMVAVACVDADGKSWASLVFGKPGFLSTPNGTSIRIALTSNQREPSDPVWEHMQIGSRLGLLFIELGTRRRYRVNGTVASIDEAAVEVAIAEAYPNCPKYIQRRHLRSQHELATRPAQNAGQALTAALGDVIRQADTLFVASNHVEGHLDASHRGGAPGFIAFINNDTLRIPDYQGNSLFNTLGNLHLNPQCGLVIPDFAGNQLLHLNGRAVLHWDIADEAGLSGGTHRFWDFHIDAWRLRELPLSLEWEYLDASPFNPSVAI
jgi:predicted pyridoxine 5'-phosphate oxidase superfamily flavin-nucleotide-binding protein